jgi:luciferase family oxidoreductase group 1
LAAQMGLPFAFASHFAPDYLMRALEVYRATFRPSAQLAKPYAMAGLNAFAAATDDEARHLFTSLQQQFINLRRGTPGPLPPPRKSMDGYWSRAEQEMVDHSLAFAVVGSPETVERGLKSFIDATGVDEIMVTGQIFDHQARLRSFDLVAQARTRLAAGTLANAG